MDVRKSLSITFLAIQINTKLFLNFFLQNGRRRPVNFGCPKFTFDRISDHFRSIRNFFYFLENGRRRPFWMFENHFRSHFWPFQINRPFWMFEIHFRWHFWPFQIHTDHNFFLIFDKMATDVHFGCLKITFNFWPFQIDTQLFF